MRVGFQPVFNLFLVSCAVLAVSSGCSRARIADKGASASPTPPAVQLPESTRPLAYRLELDLSGEGANAFVVGTRNVESVRSEIEFIFRHRFGGSDDQLFDSVDFPIHDGSDGWSGWR